MSKSKYIIAGIVATITAATGILVYLNNNNGTGSVKPSTDETSPTPPPVDTSTTDTKVE